MQCIFCHKDSSTSKSVEHIIPESLGNKEHILPKGYVCDACNNYFSVKIEKELLAQPYFVSMRRRNDIRTKKGRFVAEEMLFPGAQRVSDTMFNLEENTIYIKDDVVVKSIIDGRCTHAIARYIEEPEYPNIIMSRFIAKCAYESIFLWGGEHDYQIWLKEKDDKDTMFRDFDGLRKFARYGIGEWEYSQRRIYSEGTFFSYKGCEPYEVLHEQKFFYREVEKIAHVKALAQELGCAVFRECDGRLAAKEMLLQGGKYVICVGEDTADLVKVRVPEGQQAKLHGNAQNVCKPVCIPA